jgi:hypothetical protein
LFYHLVYKSWVGHLNLLWGWSTLHFVGWVVMLLESSMGGYRKIIRIQWRPSKIMQNEFQDEATACRQLVWMSWLILHWHVQSGILLLW